MINLAWGGYTNGAVPDSATSVIDSAGHRIEHVAAANFLAMQAACLAATGRTFYVAPGADSANRTLAQENADWAIYQNGGNTAAVPGTSNHGWARAVDITGYETALGGWVFGRYVNLGVVWRWLMANCARFGFSWATGQASRESWHFESIATPSATATASVTSTPINQEEEDMAAKYQIVSAPAPSTSIYFVHPGGIAPIHSVDPELKVLKSFADQMNAGNAPVLTDAQYKLVDEVMQRRL